MLKININEFIYELIGTIFILIITCKSIIFLDMFNINNSLVYALAYSGISVIFLIGGENKRSFFNPVLAIMSYFIEGTFSVNNLLSYIFIHIISSIVGSSMLILSTSKSQINILKDKSKLGIIGINNFKKGDILKYFLLEIIFSFIITFVIITSNRKIKEFKQGYIIKSVMLRFITLFTCSAIGFYYNGGAINPILIIGTTLLTFNLSQPTWYYFFGPIIGILITKYVYNKITLKKEEENKKYKLFKLNKIKQL